MKSLLRSIILVFALSISACSNNSPVITATTTPTIVPTKTSTPESTSTPTPEPTPVMTIYNSSLGVSFAYPEGWLVSESEGIISIASDESVQLPQPGDSFGHGEILMEILVAPLDYQIASDPLNVLGSYTNFLGVDMPEKELAHLTTLNDKEFAIGTYSEDYMKTAPHGSRAPLFIATHFTELNTLLLDMYASPKDENGLRKLFEDFLVSLKALP